MQENINNEEMVNQNINTEDTQIDSNIEVSDNKSKDDKEENADSKSNSQEEIVAHLATVGEEKVPEEKVEILPKKAIKFEDGTLITNLKITYKNLFDFQNSYDNSKDLMEALVKKQTFDHEVMVQLIYVAYLGTNPTNKMEYFDFIDAIPFDYKRDLNLFQDLTRLKADSKN